jgi:hypothetical protein
MQKIQGLYFSAVITTLVVVAGCASSRFYSSRKPADENFEQMSGNYDKIHPLYAIECASSKFDEKGHAVGGPYGHSFMYLKGACRDKSYPYPRIKVCDPGTDPDAFYANPENGVGLALDKTLQNTRYIATDGYNFLINGDLSPKASLDNNAFQAAIRKLVSDGDTKGVILHQEYMDDKKNPEINKGDLNMSDDEWIANEVIGSSFAVDFARNLGCVAVPINQKMLQAAVDYVNNQNQDYVTGKKVFDWNPVSDQSVQFVHNVFAAMGIGKHINVSSGHSKLVKWGMDAFDFATFVIPGVRSRMPAPANELDMTDQETNGAKLYTLNEAYQNKTVRQNFNNFGRIPATDGVLIWKHSAHTTDNQYFNVDAPLTPVDFPVIKPIARTFRKLTEMPTTSMIQENLAAYQLKIQTVLTSMDITADDGRRIVVGDSQYCEFAGLKIKKAGADFNDFCERYTAYLLAAKSDASNNMVKLNNLPQ